MSILLKVAALALFCQNWSSVSGNTVELTESHGSFWSENFPEPYGFSERNWLIRLPNSADKVFLRFKTFDILEKYDSLTVYDGETTNYRVLGVLYGNITKGHSTLDFISSRNTMLISFNPSAFGYATGFLAEYYSATRNNLLTNPQGWFSTPYNPNNYSNNELIRWTIQQTGKYTTTNLHIGPLSTEECCDKLEISTNNGILGTYSTANQPPSVISVKDDTLRITFSSDSSTSAAGFSARYTLGQHHEASNTIGEFTSQYYPSNYPAILTESWTIQVKNLEMAKIHLTFKEFETEEKDIVQIFDGKNENAPLIATLSGLASGRQFVSSGKFLHLKFTSDLETENRGFLARYEAVPDNFQLV